MCNHMSLDEQVKAMRGLGEVLMPYNFPKVPAEEEEDVNSIKTREITVDGYTLIVHYSKAEYQQHYLETLQVLGKYTPFLPFSLVCKIGRRFLGPNHLSFVELFKGNKIYCWTVVKDRDDIAVPGPYNNDIESRIFEGFEYRVMDSKQVNFY